MNLSKPPATGHVVMALVLSVGLWCIMVFWSLAHLRHLAGGLAPFDLRPFGYDVTEARTLLHALSEIGRDYYADVQLTLDTAYPATYALSRGLLLLWLMAPGRLADQPFPAATKVLLVALPVITAGFDYLENSAIADVLVAGPSVTTDVVERASFFTRAKSLMSLLTEMTVVALLVVAFTRWWQKRYVHA